MEPKADFNAYAERVSRLQAKIATDLGSIGFVKRGAWRHASGSSVVVAGMEDGWLLIYKEAGANEGMRWYVETEEMVSHAVAQIAVRLEAKLRAHATFLLIEKYGIEIQNIIDNRTAVEYTWTGLLKSFADELSALQ